jgi:N-acetylmuramoyl-L-alanine amidase
MKVKTLRSPNYSFKKRKRDQIQFIIIHYTGMQSEGESITRLTHVKSKVSAHYLINKRGILTSMVEEDKTAWHAGKSKWKNFNDLNCHSIGIELVNKGHSFGYENFANKQIKKLIDLCKYLMKKYKIKQANILGHADIAPLRKKDPGEKFPWKLLAKKKIGYWHNTRKKNNTPFDLKKLNLRDAFFDNLHKIGYRYFDRKKPSSSDRKVTKAFQRRFRQHKVNGRIDKECYKISHYLAYSMKN